MEINDISSLAAKETMPDGLDSAERCLWYGMRDVYRDFRAKKLDKEAGQEARKKLIAQFEKDKRPIKEANERTSYMAKFWTNIELAAAEYARKPTLKTADAFFEAVYRVPRKNKGEEATDGRSESRAGDTGANQA